MSKELKFIDKIGVEIEGGWDKSRGGLTEDGSIRSGDFSNSVCVGELIGQPMNFEDNVEFMKKNWPTETQVKCGFHIHWSLKDIGYYAALMEKKFFDYYVDCMTEWGNKYPVQNRNFWDRLQDKNKFCRKKLDAQAQIFAKKKNDVDRYTQLHYGYGIHKTIESRLFPTFVSVDTAVSGLEALVDCIESYLEKNPPKKYGCELSENLEENEHPNDGKELIEEIAPAPLPKKVSNKPFNLFMAKGAVPKEKFGVEYLDKMEKRNTRKNKRPLDMYDDGPVPVAYPKAYNKANAIYGSQYITNTNPVFQLPIVDEYEEPHN